ncbi:TetR/AcrR family transcriptional regulator [Pseudomonas sp. ML96]|uniref:TetR/AcrR family transcriptional regulator n=1 Tax=Pseudomonas sp. ML96 TaxID=1523503 RepID=UPI00068EE4AE|nr:TetR/AcrR family transcriptional regulator [Pseudomonas sp. ML96]
MSDAESKPRERVYGGQEAIERKSERRQRLIEAGIRLFSASGYHATTVRAIITESGLATRYFYESFQNQEELLIACYEHLMSGFSKKLDAILGQEHDSLEGLVRAGIRCYFEAVTDPSFLRITQIEILGVSESVDRMYFGALKNYGDLILRTAIGDAEKLKGLNIPEEDIVTLGATITGAVSIVTAIWARENYLRPIDRMVDITLVMIMGISSYLTTAPNPLGR